MTTQLSRRAFTVGVAAALASGMAHAADTPVELSFALSSTSFGTAAVRVAAEAGLFAKHGIAAKFIVMDSGNAATSALISHSAPFAVSGPGEVLTARARRQPVVIIANAYRGLAASLVLSKDAVKRSGITADAPIAQRLKALDGLSIAEPSATSAYVAPFRDAATAAGATIKLVYMAQPAMPAALEAGAIQGMVAGAPFWGAAVLKGMGVVWISGPGGDLSERYVPSSTACIQTTADYARAHPDLIHAIQAAMNDLAVLIAQHPDQAKAALQKAYPQLEPAALDLAFGKESAAWTHPKFSPDDIRHEIELLKANGAAIPGLDQIDPKEVLEFQA